MIDLPPDARPEELLRELTAAGATLVSLNPLRETLEDVFVRRVAAMGDGARRGAGHERRSAASPSPCSANRCATASSTTWSCSRVLLVGASILIGQLTAGQDVKIIKDLGLAATSLFGLFIAIFVGISLVSKEVDRRSVYPLLAKPVRRVRAHRRQVLRAAADAARRTSS